MRKNHFSSFERLYIILLAALLLAGCSAYSSSPAQEAPGYKQIDQDTAKQMMLLDDGHVIVDVRRQDEYDAGHIPGAILIPNESIVDEQPAELPDLDQIILIYCRTGNRSKQAAQKLANMGYTNVYEFGGINTWTGEIMGSGSADPAVTPVEIEQNVNASEDDNSEVSSDDASDNTMDAISEEQAYTAVINYCKATDPEFPDESSAEGHTEYWDVSTNEDGEIVVLYRSYTAAQIRYYIQPFTGEAYVTELVPGIIDNEQATGKTFNARDYLVASDPRNEETPPADNASVPVEYETADGF